MGKMFLALLLTAIVLPGLAGLELLTGPDDPACWGGKVRRVQEAERGKGPCFELYGKYPTPLVWRPLIPVDPAKTYVLKVSFRSVSAELPASAYLGVELYDAQKRLIAIRNMWTKAGSESEVVSARAGDDFLTVKMIPDHAKFKACVVAFGAMKDGSDLPNFDLSARIAAMKPGENGNLRIELKKPLAKSYPAGTPVRLHAYYPHSMYDLAAGWVPAGPGIDHTVRLYSEGYTPGGTGGKTRKFWKGTKYFRPFVWFGNWNRKPKPGAKLLIDGWSVTEIPSAEKGSEGNVP
ncbi:MAG: hypothetical protein IJS14_01715 [Lentisphaeria bacterium]|nr:hypothetical protein [Lentisphaeria bacterium]